MCWDDLTLSERPNLSRAHLPPVPGEAVPGEAVPGVSGEVGVDTVEQLLPRECGRAEWTSVIWALKPFLSFFFLVYFIDMLLQFSYFFSPLYPSSALHPSPSSVLLLP